MSHKKKKFQKDIRNFFFFWSWEVDGSTADRIFLMYCVVSNIITTSGFTGHSSPLKKKKAPVYTELYRELSVLLLCQW